MITAELDTSTIEITNSIDNVALNNTNIITGYDNSYNVDIEDLSDLDITVAKKEYAIVGDDIYIPQLYDDAPQWMKDLVELVVDVSMTTNSTKLINDMNAMLQEFAVSYVPLNQYTQSILDLGNEDMRLNALIETLNSNFSNGLSNANAQIINLQMTKASKDEVVAQVIQTLAAQLADPDSNLGATVVRLEQAVVAEQTARATSFRALTASMASTNGEIAAKAEVLENALAYVGIDEAGASTNTGLSAYLQASNGVIGGADSKVANDIRVTAQGVESKWAYNSTVNVNGVYRKSGFGLTTNNFSGGGTQSNPYTSEFWIDATKLRFTNSAVTGRTAPFTIDASGTTPQVKFNGIVEFGNVSGASQGVVNEINNGTTTTINGGRLTTGTVTAHQIQAGSITADRINTAGLIADDISTNTLNGKTINGGVINGAVINSSIIKASYLDLSSDLTIVTNFVVTPAMYNSWPAGYIDTVYISGSNTYRIPSVSPLMEAAKSSTIADNGGVLTSTIRSYNCGYAGHNLKCVKYNPTITVGGNGIILKSEGTESSRQWVLTNRLKLIVGGVQLVEAYANVYSDDHDLYLITIYINGSVVFSKTSGGWASPYFNIIKTENIGEDTITYYQLRWNYVVNGVSFSVRYDYTITSYPTEYGYQQNASPGNLSIVVAPGTYVLDRYDDHSIPIVHCSTIGGAGRVYRSPYRLAYIPTAYIGNISVVQGY